jgi:hypothetical protein
MIRPTRNPIPRAERFEQRPTSLGPPKFSRPRPRAHTRKGGVEELCSLRRSEMGASMATNHMAKRVAPRFRYLRLRPVRRLCSNCLCERGARLILIEPATLPSAVRRKHARGGAGHAICVEASSEHRLTPGRPQIVAPARSWPRRLRTRAARRARSVTLVRGRADVCDLAFLGAAASPDLDRLRDLH